MSLWSPRGSQVILTSIMALAAKSYSYAQQVTKREATNFYYAFRLLPPSRRNAIYAVYTFSRRADAAVDSVEELQTTPEEAEAKLEQLRALLRGEAPDDPLAPAIEDTIERFGVPLEHFEELIRGMEMDLHNQRYQTLKSSTGTATARQPPSACSAARSSATRAIRANTPSRSESRCS